MIFFFGPALAFDFLKICFHEFLLLHFPGMQNRFGGYENDCSVARLQDNRFMLMSPSIQQMKAYTWMRNHLPSNGSVDLQDVTSLYTSLCVLGQFFVYIYDYSCLFTYGLLLVM